MNLTVAQDQKYQEGDSWEWSVWIEGSDDDLDQIREVTYKLHPSFPRALRTTNNRTTKFKLQTEGWGTFPGIDVLGNQNRAEQNEAAVFRMNQATMNAHAT